MINAARQGSPLKADPNTRANSGRVSHCSHRAPAAVDVDDAGIQDVCVCCCFQLDLFSAFSGHMVGGVHHGRDGKGQRHLPGHRSYPSQLWRPVCLPREPLLPSLILHLARRVSRRQLADPKHLLSHFYWDPFMWPALCPSLKRSFEVELNKEMAIKNAPKAS